MRYLYLLLVLCALSACASLKPEEETLPQLPLYVHDGPPTLTLFTMINNETDFGAHSGLMVSASQRVIFDPAGTLKHEVLNEHADVLYGVTPSVLDFYTRAHARKTYHVAIQTIEVSPEVAEHALRLVQNNGEVWSAHCAHSISKILRQISGFEGMNITYRPQKLRQAFSQYAGVSERVLYEYDDDDKSKALREYVAELALAQATE